MGIAVIMAGGFGKRLWPESRLNHPKQFLSLKNRESLIQSVYRRSTRIFGIENTFIVTRRELKESILSHLPHLSSQYVIDEPMGRDTAPCIGFAAIWIRKRKGDFPMVVLPSDHLIEGEDKFKRVMEVAIKQAERGHLVTIGIRPTRPETGYGYLQLGEKIEELSGIPLYKLERFTEKPSQKKAKEFFESKNFLWNAGMFAWYPGVILEEIKKYLPPLYEGLKKIEEALGTPDESEVIEKVYPELPGISIDYAVMEKTKKAVVIPADFYWDDIGDWQALERIFPKDEKGNIIRGVVKEIQTTNSTFINGEDKILAAIGVSNVIVVNSEKGLLIVAKELSQKVKNLVDEMLKDEDLKKYVE